MVEKLIKRVKLKEDEWYSNKIIFSLPDWFTLESNPEMVSLLAIHGIDGLKEIKRKVDFDVDFKKEDSILNYVAYLEKQMNKSLDVIGYVFFYKKKIKGAKDSSYLHELTKEQMNEINTFNEKQLQYDITVVYFDVDFNIVDSF